MPTSHVELFPNRTLGQNRNLARELTDGFVRARGSLGHRFQVIITEVHREGWSVSSELMFNR